jgi:hypothetical protein
MSNTHGLYGGGHDICQLVGCQQNTIGKNLDHHKTRGELMRLIAIIFTAVVVWFQLGIANGAPLLGRDINGQTVDAKSPDAAFLYDPLSDKTTLLQVQLITNQFPGCANGSTFHLCDARADWSDFRDVQKAVWNLPFGGWVFPSISVNCDPPYPGPSFGAAYVCHPSEIWPYQSTFWSITWYEGNPSHLRAFTTAAYPEYFASRFPIPMPFRFGDVSTVSTPATIALLGLGLVGIGAARRKQA